MHRNQERASEGRGWRAGWSPATTCGWGGVSLPSCPGSPDCLFLPFSFSLSFPRPSHSSPPPFLDPESSVYPLSLACSPASLGATSLGSLSLASSGFPAITHPPPPPPPPARPPPSDWLPPPLSSPSLPAPSSLPLSLSPLPSFTPASLPTFPSRREGRTSPSPGRLARLRARRWGRRHLAGCRGGSRERAIETIHLL